MHALGRGLLWFLAVGVGAYAVVGYSAKPLGDLVHPEMKASFVLHPAGIYTHVFASAVALLLGPFQFSARLRRERLRLHRWLGRIYLGIGVGAGGLSGLYLAPFAFGGAAGRLGFVSLAVAWLVTGARGYLAARRGAVEEHRRWMVRNFALTFAAVTLRLYLPASVLAGIDFEVAYAAVAWLCWIPNLLAAEGILRARPVSSR